MVCHNCNSDIPSDSNVCPYCGTILKEWESASSTDELDPSSHKIHSHRPLWPLQIILLVLSIVFTCSSLFQFVLIQSQEKMKTSLQQEVSQKAITVRNFEKEKESLISAESVWAKASEDSQYAAIFYRTNVVYILNDGTLLYHRYGCPSYTAAMKYEAMGKTIAAALGYVPCSLCSAD